ncbi:MAG: 4Fe-4S dicluster domain-containing protein [Desulfovibrionaceae bacterium]
MKNTDFFRVEYGDVKDIVRVEDPSLLYYSLMEHKTTLKKKAEVVRGECIATSAESSLFAASSGVVAEVTSKYIAIESVAVEKEQGLPVDFLSLTPDMLRSQLVGFGFSKGKLPASTTTLIVNALYTDIGLNYIPSLFAYERDTLEKGLELLSILSPSVQVQLAIPVGSSLTLKGANSFFIDPVYPYTVDELVIAKTIGQENPRGGHCISLQDLWHLGMLASEGFPLAEKILTVGNCVLRAKVGTQIAFLLEKADVSIDDGDALSMNGLLRGYPIGNMESGISQDVHAVLHIPKGHILHSYDADCVQCGYCTNICPARLTVQTMTTYAEHLNIEACQEESIDSCFECGLCAYVCITKRPLLQYIRNVKKASKNLLPMAN